MMRPKLIASEKHIRAAILRTQGEIDDPRGTTGLTAARRDISGRSLFTVDSLREEAQERLRVLKSLLQ